MRIGGDCDCLRIASCDVASQQADDSWTSRGKLERPEHACDRVAVRARSARSCPGGGGQLYDDRIGPVQTAFCCQDRLSKLASFESGERRTQSFALPFV